MSESFIKWLDHIDNNCPWFVNRPSKIIKALRKKFSNTEISEDELFWVQSVLGPLGSLGFEKVSMSHIELSQAHLPHYTFRNEWWRLRGFMVDPNGNRYYLSWIVWRRSTLPSELWGESSPQDQSLVKFLVSFTKESEMVYSPVETIRENHGCSITQNGAFEVLQDNCNQVTSSPFSLFPLTFKWKVSDKVINLTIDNAMPPFMLNSNGCAPCRDGLGMKQYTYPSISGYGFIQTHGHADAVDVKFRGFWDHRWESGLVPIGFSSSIYIRSLNSMSLQAIDGWSDIGNTIEIIALLSNNCTLYAQIKNVDKIHNFHNPVFSNVRIIKSDGFVDKNQTVSVDIIKVVQILDIVEPIATQIRLVGSRFDIIVSVIATNFDCPVQTHIDVPISVKGHYEESPVEGWGFLHTTATYKDKVLSRYIGVDITTLEQEDKNERTNLWIIWFIPLITVLVLMLLIIYLMYHKKSKFKVLDQSFQKKISKDKIIK